MFSMFLDVCKNLNDNIRKLHHDIVTDHTIDMNSHNTHIDPTTDNTENKHDDGKYINNKQSIQQQHDTYCSEYHGQTRTG